MRFKYRERQPGELAGIFWIFGVLHPERVVAMNEQLILANLHRNQFRTSWARAADDLESGTSQYFVDEQSGLVEKCGFR